MTYKVEALEREATGEGWAFEFDGETYELPHDFDMRVAAKLSSGDLHDALRLLLGDEQWDRLNASPKIFGLRALSDLLDAWTSDIGVEVGELRASSTSSKRTVAPSKRTSNGSTGSRSRTSSHRSRPRTG